MAYIKIGTPFNEIMHKEFEILYSPGKEAFYAGIYQCDLCSLEIVHPGKCELPRKNKDDAHSHRWRLLVSIIKPFPVIPIEDINPMQ
jgi:hypothetical protein